MQCHSQVGKAQLGQLTALIECLTVLFEYIDVLILFAQITFGWIHLWLHRWLLVCNYPAVMCIKALIIIKIITKRQQCLCSTHPEGGHLTPMTPLDPPLIVSYVAGS